MCVWISTATGCGHHSTRLEMCDTKLRSQQNGFLHVYQCPLLETSLDVPGPCSKCLRTTTIATGQQQPKVLGADYQEIKKRKAQALLNDKPLPPIPGSSPSSTASGTKQYLASWYKSIRHKRDGKTLQSDALPQGHTGGTPREYHKAVMPGPHSSFDLRGTQLSDQKLLSTQREAELFLNVPAQNQARMPECLIPGGAKRIAKQVDGALPTQKSSSYQQEAELFLNVPGQNKVPDCLVPGRPSRMAKQMESAPLSAQFDKSRRTPNPRSIPTRKPLPVQGKVAPSSRAEPLGRFEVDDYHYLNQRSSLFPPRLPTSKRLSTLHFEGTVLDSHTK